MHFIWTDTITIVEKNLSKFKIDQKELNSRRYFIDATRDEVKSMKEKMSLNRNRDKDITANQPLLDNNNQTFGDNSAFNDNCNNLIANNCINNNITSCNTNSASSFTVSFFFSKKIVFFWFRLNSAFIHYHTFISSNRQRLLVQWPEKQQNTPNWRIHWTVPATMELQLWTVRHIDFLAKVYRYSNECYKGKMNNLTLSVIRLAR